MKTKEICGQKIRDNRNQNKSKTKVKEKTFAIKKTYDNEDQKELKKKLNKRLHTYYSDNTKITDFQDKLSVVNRLKIILIKQNFP